MHQVGTDQPGESERAMDDPISIVGQAQQQKRNQRDHNLDANGVLGGPEEVADFQDLFDPSEEQLDGPAPPVKVGDVLCARHQIVGEDAQYLAGLGY